MKTQFRKIVIGIDFSDASLAGARWVSTHLAPRAELLLVHVAPLPRPPIYLHEHLGSTRVNAALSGRPGGARVMPVVSEKELVTK